MDSVRMLSVYKSVIRGDRIPYHDEESVALYRTLLREKEESDKNGWILEIPFDLPDLEPDDVSEA
jgi:hypothetical protein